jgi:hypothetical protein
MNRIRPLSSSRDGAQGQLYSRPGNDLSDRFPLLVEALARLRSLELDVVSSVRVRKDDRKRESAHQNEANGPSRIEIEPAPRHELEAQVAVHQPRGESASRDHRRRVDNGDQNGHAEIGVDEGTCRLMASVEVGGPTESQIDRYEHQSRAMRGRYREGPEPQLRRSYPCQCPRMAPVDQPEDTKPDDQEAGPDLDLSLPFDEGDKQPEGKEHQEHRQQMAD